jgi:hypothetical protein
VPPPAPHDAGYGASPFDERLYRVLLEAADRQGHPAGVEAVMGELQRLLEPGGAPEQRRGPPAHDRCSLVHPQTAALYRSLSRHVPAALVGAVGASGGGSPRL